MFSRTILGNADECRTECEISDDTGIVAIVYETPAGWQTNMLREIGVEERSSFNANLEAARQSLSHYVNRMGNNPPEGITAAALSLWLMQTDDCSAFSSGLTKQESHTGPMQGNLSVEFAERIRSIARSGRPLQAIRELRIATDCSLEEAKAWLEELLHSRLGT